MDSVKLNLTFIATLVLTCFAPSTSIGLGELMDWEVYERAVTYGGGIRVCTGTGGHYETPTAACPMGIFLKEPMVPGCVCMRGMWVLHSTLCDNSPYVFYGELEQELCYQINFNVSMFVYLGDPHDITQSRTYVAPHSLTVFNEIVDDGSSTPLMDFYWPSIISVHPSKSIKATETGKSAPTCFSKIEYVPKKMKVRGHIWDGARGPTSYQLVDSCKGMIAGGYDNLIGTSNDFFYRSNSAVTVPFTPCGHPCKASTTGTRKRRSPQGDRSLDKMDPSGLEKSTADGSEMTSEGSGDSLKLLRRQKRYKTRDTVETTWDGYGFCMTSYWDPLLKFEMSNTEEIRCYPENKGIFKPKPT